MLCQYVGKVIILLINIDDIKINYRVNGHGKNIILLHGWGACINSFRPVYEYLEKHFCTYTLDLPGFGESSEPKEPWGVPEYADIVCKFIDQLKIENPILVGHSNGGRISIYIASHRKINKVILVDSAGVIPKRSLKYYLKVYSYKTVKNIFKLPVLNKYSEKVLTSFKKKSGSEDYRNSSGVMQKTMVKLVNTDLTPLMPKMTSSTLLIWGDKDTATPVSDGQLMEKLIPDAGLVVLKNAGHFSYLDKFNEFIIIVANFLSNDMEEKNE